MAELYQPAIILGQRIFPSDSEVTIAGFLSLGEVIASQVKCIALGCLITRDFKYLTLKLSELSVATATQVHPQNCRWRCAKIRAVKQRNHNPMANDMVSRFLRGPAARGIGEACAVVDRVILSAVGLAPWNILQSIES